MDEVSDDFLLEACTMSLKQKEWPSYEHTEPEWHARDGWRSNAIPLMISECQHLILEWDADEETYHTYPNNMPEFDITVIEIVGTILRLTEDDDYLQLHVYDGTGIMIINYDLEEYEELRRNRLKIDKYYGITPAVLKNASRLMNQLISNRKFSSASRQRRRSWWTASGKGMFGKELKVGDYVNAFGCVQLMNDPELEHKTPWDIGVLPKMEFLADHVDAIDEETYATKFEDFIGKGIHKYAIKSEEETTRP